MAAEMGAVPCPDPSAHVKGNKLSEAASTAALYATSQHNPDSRSGGQSRAESALGPDGKLSSRSAAASLKYANAKDLPSFPSSGNTANSASAAAMLAKDYKMKELWQAEQSMAGSKAALLAHEKGPKLDLWQASASADGQSAATLAFRNKGLSPQAYGGNSADDKNKALLAATQSVRAGRQRAESTPTVAPPLYPDQHNSGKNALSAATTSHSASIRKPDHSGGWNDEANQAARIKNAHMDRNLFTGEPDIKTDEDRHQAALRASAMSMAKAMYANQDRSAMLADPDNTDGHDRAGALAAARNQAVSHPDVRKEALQYISLQDQAHKLAAERLAKINKDTENARYRDYYGYESKPKRLSSRLSMTSRDPGHKRAASEGTSKRRDSDSDSDDERQARRIRSQMANLNTGLQTVDAKKQQEDRAKVLAAAEKRVAGRMHDMDEQIYRDTGKVTPAMMEEWETKARERAQRDREERAQNSGKTHIGGGKFMDQSEIEAIAAARLKPTLDEINDTAEKRRARDAEIAAEKQEQERKKMEEKMRDQAQKEEFARIRNEDKAAAKKAKEEEKARKAEEKRIEKEDKRKSKEHKRDTITAAAGGATLAEAAENLKEDNEATDDAAAIDGREKHRSALGRLKDRFRKSGVPDEKKAEDETEKEAESKSEPTTITPITTGVATGAATGAAVTNVADSSNEPLDPQQASHAIAQEEERPTTATTATTVTPAEPTPVIVEPVSPLETTEKHAALAEPAESTMSEGRDIGPISEPYASNKAHSEVPIVAATAGVLGAGAIGAAALEDSDADDDDSLYEPEEKKALKPSRPTFQQHPSMTGYHYDNVDGDDAKKPDLERHISRIPESDGSSISSDDEEWNDGRIGDAPAAAAAPVALAGTTAATAAFMHPEPQPPVLGNEVHDETMTRLEEQRAQPPEEFPAGLQAPGVPSETPADAVSTTAVKSTQASPVQKTNEFEGHNKLHKKGAPVVDPIESSKKVQDEQSIPSTKAEKSDDKEEKKGLKGFFGKLRSKNKSEKQPGQLTSSNNEKFVAYQVTTAGEQPTTVGSKSEIEKGVATSAAAGTTIPPVDTGSKFEIPREHIGTDGPIGDSHLISGLHGNPAPAEPESPSSFQRHDGDLANPDDVSSSGVDEEDMKRGRGGRLVKKLGFGKSRTTERDNDAAKSEKAQGKEKAFETEAGPERMSSTTDDNETFEEARDHFDETLAPPAAFAGQSKSSSPVRTTKFHEEV